ncbi:hypothetical protein AGMMS50267_18410 [Spirochaetia bacterium]|nr:hypothetical protein AGMMS50267_18410 [Spirochaetia bacterium]
MEETGFKLTDADKRYLEYYCKECPGGYFSKMIKALLLLDQDCPTDEIEKILSIRIESVKRYREIYLKYGLDKLLEGDLQNRYNIYFKMKTHGCMNLCFEFVNLNIEIHLSAVFDPIPDLLKFISKISDNEESIILNIDEEGHYKTIILTKAYVLLKELYELKIVSDGFPFNEYEFKKIIYKDVFLKKIIDAFTKLADENKETNWVSYYNLSELIHNNIKNIKENISKEKPNCT